LRLGFKGRFHDYPQELADYTRRLFTRLPAYAGTRAKEMFPDAYQHNQELKVDYKLGMSLTLVLVILSIVVGASALTFRLAWNNAVSEIEQAAEVWNDVAATTPPEAVVPESSSGTMTR
jgi:type VI protein secretion system component VasF